MATMLKSHFSALVEDAQGRADQFMNYTCKTTRQTKIYKYTETIHQTNNTKGALRRYYNTYEYIAKLSVLVEDAQGRADRGLHGARPRNPPKRLSPLAKNETTGSYPEETRKDIPTGTSPDGRRRLKPQDNKGDSLAAGIRGWG